MTQIMMKAHNKILSTGGKKAALFTPPHEAFILTMYANNEDRWKARIDYCVANGVDIASGKFPKRKGKVDGVKVPDPLHDAKFSRNDAGQERFDTFSEEGLQFFVDTTNMLREARTDKTTAVERKTFELTFLTHLQEKYAKELEAATSKSKKRKLGENALQKKNKRKSLGSMAGLAEDEELLDVDLWAEEDSDETTLEE